MIEISDYSEGELWLILRQQRLQLTDKRKKLIDVIDENAARIQRISTPGEYAPQERSFINKKRDQLQAKMRLDHNEVKKIDERLAALDAGEDILEGGIRIK